MLLSLQAIIILCIGKPNFLAIIHAVALPKLPDGIVNISPADTNKKSTKYQCYGLNLTAVKRLIISKGGVPSKWKHNTRPMLCRAILGYIQGIVISVEKMNKINDKRTVDADSIKSMAEIVDSCSCL